MAIDTDQALLFLLINIFLFLQSRHRTPSASSPVGGMGISNGHVQNGIVGIGGSRRDSMISATGDQTDDGTMMSDEDVKGSSTKFSKQHLVSSDSRISGAGGSREGGRKGIRKYLPHIKGRFHAKISENERGISLEFGKFVALISITGNFL